MRSEPVTFFSDGLRLSGAFMLPDDPPSDGRAPLVVACSGFTGLMQIHPARFARVLTAAGLPCFAFDYRGFAESEGPRGRVLLEEQVRDIVHAAAFAAGDARIDAERLLLLGWGMGAGLVLDAARGLSGVIGLLALNGFYDGARVQQAHRGADGMHALLEMVRAERQQRVRSGAPRRVDPFEIYPLDPVSRQYVDSTLRRYDHYATEDYSLELAESLLRWRPEAYAAEMRIPLLIAHGDANVLHPTAEAEALHAAWGGPKELFWLRGAGHTEFMHDDNPLFQELGAVVVRFVRRVVG